MFAYVRKTLAYVQQKQTAPDPSLSIILHSTEISQSCSAREAYEQRQLAANNFFPHLSYSEHLSHTWPLRRFNWTCCCRLVQLTSLFLYNELMMSFIIRSTSAWNVCFSALSRISFNCDTLNPSSLMASSSLNTMHRNEVIAGTQWQTNLPFHNFVVGSWAIHCFANIIFNHHVLFFLGAGAFLK